jgi:transcriptional regulator with XRE-family HTH domain
VVLSAGRREDLSHYRTEKPQQGRSLRCGAATKCRRAQKSAREANISYHTVIKIEQSVIKNPRIETVIKLADALGVSIDELVGRK